MIYVNHNDYELLYLVEEGCERALDFLYQKYMLFVNKLAYEIYPYGDKRYDLIQEGMMILFNCIKSFNKYLSVPFFAYFSISLKRRLYYLTNKDKYYKRITFLDYEIADMYGSCPGSYLLNSNYMCDTELDVLIYQEHMLNGMSLLRLCEMNNISYNKAYKRKKALVADLKKMLTKS
ncbi:MAG: hypothetical protein E7176_05845 [Erysipelotrichaceae bacterium]|nr:hypothetical protein [Erysipelotrichaceae bacterium]